MCLPLPPSPSSVLICWCFLCWWVPSSRMYPGVPGFYLLFFMVGLPWAMHVRAKPSLIHTLLGACGLNSLRDELQTLPGQCVLLPVGAHTPQLVPVVSVLSEMRCRHSQVVRTVFSGCLWSHFPLRLSEDSPWLMITVPGGCAHYPVAVHSPRLVPVVPVPWR